MPRNPRYDILFEPVRIGPVTARNRFYQVPHCSGMGYALPQTLAAMREVKAEGGWGVVCTEYCSIHPTSDDGGFAFATLWDDDDVKAQALMTDGGASPWRARRRRAVAWRPSRREPLQPRGAAVAVGPAAPFRASGADAGDGQGRHPRAPALAGGGRQAGAGGRLRHRLCLCRPRLPAVPVHRPPLQPAQRRIWRQPREPRPPAARDDRGDEGRGRRSLRGGGAARRRRADGPAGRHRGGGRPRHRGHAGGAAGPLGRQHQRRRQRFHERALLRGGLPGALCRLRQAAHDEAGRRRRPLHLARHDGRPDPQGRARFHRRGAAFHRRSLPAAQDRRGPRGRDPRMHRLQHLPLRQQRGRADPLHAESDHGRGVAARLASRTHRAGRRARRRSSSSAAGRPASNAPWPSASAAMPWRSPRPPPNSAAA